MLSSSLPFFPAEHANLVLHSHELSPTNNSDRREGGEEYEWSGLGRERQKRLQCCLP